MKKVLLILSIIILLPTYSFGEIGMGILSEQAGVSHSLSLRMNNGYYHKIFSLGKGPFNPAPGMWIEYFHDKYFGEINFSYSLQTLTDYFGYKIPLSFISFDIYGGYIYKITDNFFLMPKLGIGESDYTIYYNDYSIGDLNTTVKALLELSYIYKNTNIEQDIFFSLSAGIQNPIRYTLGDAGSINNEPYLFILKIGLLQ